MGRRAGARASPFAANHFHHFVEPHVANIDILGAALPDRGDAVAHFQSPIDLRRTAGDKALDFRVAIFGAKHRADADEREAHVDAEIFQVGFAQIFGMRVVGLGERIEKKLHLLVLVFLMHVAREAIVAPRHQLRPGLDRMFAQMFLQQLAGDAPAPKLIGFRVIFRPGRFLAAKLDRPVSLEIERLFEQLFHFRHARVDALLVQIVNLVSRFQIAEQNIVIDRRAVLRVDGVDILLREEKMTEVEQFEIRPQKFARDFVIEGLMRVMAFLEKPAHRNANLFSVGFCLKRLRI